MESLLGERFLLQQQPAEANVAAASLTAQANGEF